MRGPSTLDCEKSFARTGIYSANMHRKQYYPSLTQGLVQITAAQPA
jgi:NOL1/NOP2/fmu family ribosome biogenesis protein